MIAETTVDGRLSSLGLVTDAKRGVQYQLRSYAGPQDDAVIYHPWCRQIRQLHPFNRFDKDEFAAHKESVIEPLVTRLGCTFAANPDDPRLVYAWIVGEVREDTQILHYIYVKDRCRQAGVATRLMRVTFPRFRVAPIYLTHPSRAARHLLDKWQLKFNPYLVAE